MHGAHSRVQVEPPPSDRPPKIIGPVAPSSSGIATMMVASTGSSPRSERRHCSSVWNSTGCAATIGHVELRQNVFGRLGVVVGGPADQGEPGQRNHRIDGGDGHPS